MYLCKSYLFLFDEYEIVEIGGGLFLATIGLNVQRTLHILHRVVEKVNEQAELEVLGAESTRRWRVFFRRHQQIRVNFVVVVVVVVVE